MALGRSFFSTSVGTNACDAGPPKACAEPVINESTRMCQTCTLPEKTRAASVNAVDIWMYCDTSSVLRRPSLSPRAPPRSGEGVGWNVFKKRQQHQGSAQPSL